MNYAGSLPIVVGRGVRRRSGVLRCLKCLLCGGSHLELGKPSWLRGATELKLELDFGGCGPETTKV